MNPFREPCGIRVPLRPFSMPALPQKTLGVSKSSPVLRRDEAQHETDRPTGGSAQEDGGDPR